jgi:hypothetical protein
MFPSHSLIPTLPRRTSGYSGASKLDLLAEVSANPKNYQKVFENFWMEFPLKN